MSKLVGKVTMLVYQWKGLGDLKLKIVSGCRSVKGKEANIKRGKAPQSLAIKSNPWQIMAKQLVVTDVTWQQAGSRSAGKAAAGAIIGGVLTGGIGAVAGAAIGGRKKDVSTVVITFDDGQQLYVLANGKEFEKLRGLLG